MRDAIAAAVNLNIFNNHCDTVVMANIAQMVNVLQAMLLIDGSRMLRTPTYHVFALYNGHQGARQLETYAETSLVGTDDLVPDLHVSASESRSAPRAPTRSTWTPVPTFWFTAARCTSTTTPWP